MNFVIDPFEFTDMQRAAIAGMGVAIICACVGTWVVLRGMAFLGDAMAHGLLPGVAGASLVGFNLYLGAAIAAAAMAVGVAVVQRASRLSADTAIGLLFVAMMALGVLIVSSEHSHDLTSFLFGDLHGIQTADLWLLAIAAVAVVLISLCGQRAFLALALDSRISATLGLRPQLTQVVMIAMMTIAIVSSFSVVGTLLVFGMLIAPPAAAVLWSSRTSTVMITAAVIGVVCTLSGLIISWHAETEPGATITAATTAAFFCSLIAAQIADRLPSNRWFATSGPGAISVTSGGS